MSADYLLLCSDWREVSDRFSWDIAEAIQYQTFATMQYLARPLVANHIFGVFHSNANLPICLRTASLIRSATPTTSSPTVCKKRIR